MRRIASWCLGIGGLALVLSGVAWVLFDHTVTYAQDQGRYIGASECRDCHRDMVRAHQSSRHALALQSPGRRFEAVLADFSTGEDLRTIRFPGEDMERTFTAEDIAFVIGAGRYVQRYLFEVGRNEYQVLPVEWNTVEGRWQPYPLAENWPDPAFDWTTNCAGCHTTGLNPERGRWVDAGVQCETCHGPGSQHADAAGRARRNPTDEQLARLRETIVSGADAQLCGQCHSQGLASDNLHRFPTAYQPGGDLLAEFILAAPDQTAFWWPTGHARESNMQYNEWLTAGHASALTSLKGSQNVDDTCLSCHSGDYRYTQALIAAHEAGTRRGSAPDALTPETAQMGVTCITCHNPHGQNTADFNLTAEPYALCVSCHSSQNTPQLHHPVQEMYEGHRVIPNVLPVASSHFTDENGPNCVTCHMARVPVSSYTLASHSLSPVMPGAAADVEGLTDSCTVCHQDQVDALTMQKLIDDVQKDTRARLDTARAALTEITPDWVQTALTFVEGDGSLGIHNYAYTDRLLDAVEAELGLE
jgi:predicted CXXCH cytochrome family protein